MFPEENNLQWEEKNRALCKRYFVFVSFSFFFFLSFVFVWFCLVLFGFVWFCFT